MKKTFKKMTAAVMAVMTLTVGMTAMTANAETTENEPNDILVWQETELNKLNSGISLCAYNTWENQGTKTIYGYKNSKTIGKQSLTSYTYENLTDQKKAKAVVKNYTYNSSKKSYTNGWTNSTDCYCRARVESRAGDVYEDSKRIYGQYTSTAETTNPTVGICKTYCGNKAAD